MPKNNTCGKLYIITIDTMIPAMVKCDYIIKRLENHK